MADDFLVSILEKARCAAIPEHNHPGHVGHDDAVTRGTVHDGLQEFGGIHCALSTAERDSAYVDLCECSVKTKSCMSQIDERGRGEGKDTRGNAQTTRW
jgi:hypothetical protein